MKQKAKYGTGLVLAIMAVSIAVIAVCAYQLYRSEQEYAAGDAAYEAMRNTVLTPGNAAEADDKDNGSIKDGQESIIPDIGVDLNILAGQYKDACAWLYCPDTVIDYPVMAAGDYSYYLERLPDGTYNKNGSLFLDYNCKPDFKDTLNIIYGHSMKSGKMFGGLSMYKDKEALERYPYLYLYTNQGPYRLEPLYGLVIPAEQWQDKGFMYAENMDALIEYAKKSGTALHTITEDMGQCRLTVLSTCTYEFDDARFVVLCAMRQENGKIAAAAGKTENDETRSNEIQHEGG